MTLRVKLLIMFSVLIAGMLLPFFFVTRSLAETHFRTYIYQGDITKAKVFAPLIETAYAKNQDWVKIDHMLDEPPFSFHAVPSVARPGILIHQDNPANDQDWIQERVVIFDNDHKVVIDTKHVLEGTVHPADHIANAIPLNYLDQRVGSLMVGTMIDSALNSSHEGYLSAFTTAMVIESMVASIAAFGFALIFSLYIAQPIAFLARATKRIRDGARGVQVPTRGNDEIAMLGTAFNQMSQTIAAAESYRARLLADTAHELRTPVTLIKGTLEAILDGVFSADQDTLRPVYEETVRLSKLLDSLNDLDAIQGGMLTRCTFDLIEVIKQQCGLFTSLALQKNIALSQSHKMSQLFIEADTQKIQQVIANLLSNAIRYTPENGGVIVSSLAGKNLVSIVIDDNGPGIPEAKREQVFERLYRLDSARATHSGGRGLGLSICREIINAHQGSIEITRSPLGGTRVLVCLPAGLAVE